MTDKEKLEKLVAYLGRRMYAHNQMADIGSTGEIFDEKIENAKYEECRDTLNFIDSLQEEPVCAFSTNRYTNEDRKVLCDGCEEECKYSHSVNVPFDSKNYELIEATYYIPKGMCAIIEDDKVIIKKK